MYIGRAYTFCGTYQNQINPIDSKMKDKIERINKNLTSVLQMQEQVDKLENISKEATKENKVRFEVITQLLLLKRGFGIRDEFKQKIVTFDKENERLKEIISGVQ